MNTHTSVMLGPNSNIVESSHRENGTKTRTTSSESQRWNYDHETMIQAPISLVWEHLTDISSWNWNPCLRLRADSIETSVTGRISMALQTNRWQAHEFVFDQVDRTRFTFVWTTIVGKCRITNTMKLSHAGIKATILTHTMKIANVFPGLRWKVPLKSMVYYPMFINEAFKNHVESKHFNQLLVTLSSRDMTVSTDATASMELFTENPSTVASTLNGNNDNSTVYWQSPPAVRNQILRSFLNHERIVTMGNIDEGSRESSRDFELVRQTSNSNTNNGKAITFPLFGKRER